MSGDDELEALRRRKLLELQKQAEAEQQRRESESQMLAQKEIILRQILTPEAKERLGTVRLAYPDVAENVEGQLIMLAQSGRLQAKIDDSQMRTILSKIMPTRREINIERR